MLGITQFAVVEQDDPDRSQAVFDAIVAEYGAFSPT